MHSSFSTCMKTAESKLSTVCNQEKKSHFRKIKTERLGSYCSSCLSLFSSITCVRFDILDFFLIQAQVNTGLSTKIKSPTENLSELNLNDCWIISQYDIFFNNWCGQSNFKQIEMKGFYKISARSQIEVKSWNSERLKGSLCRGTMGEHCSTGSSW